MIKKVNTDVQELKYEYKSDGFAVTDETVIITFASGFTRSVNVTCDSYKGIAEDVLKKV